MKTVLAYAKKPVGAVMMRPILERLLRDPRFAVYGCARLFGRRNAASVFRDSGLGDVALTAKWLARLRAFDVYLSADFGVAAPRSKLRVHVFHGVSFRNHGVHSNALQYDLALLAGPYMRRRFEAEGLITPANAARFPVIGMPKLDALVDGSIDRAAVLAELGLDPARRTVLWAPTWSKKVSSLERWGKDVAIALCSTGQNVIAKLHDNSLDLRKAGRDWRAELGSVDLPNFRLATQADVVPLLAAADVLVSDASSVANEFALLDRPILFLDIDQLESKLKAKADLETWGRRAGDVVPGPADLAAAIERALDRPERHSEVRRALARDLFHDPGHATDRAVGAICGALGLEPAP